MDHSNTDHDRAIVSRRTMEIVVALLILGVSVLVVADSLSIGAGWVDPGGPQAGYFPFYIGSLMGCAALVILAQAVFAQRGPRPAFVLRRAFGQVLLILIPAGLFILATQFIGIYVSAAAYIGFFMARFGKYGALASAAVAIAVPLVLFFMFEVWFLVPLPKGPLEEMLGY